MESQAIREAQDVRGWTLSQRDRRGAARPAPERATILIAEQNMHFCFGIASEAVVIDKGAIVYRDDIAGLRANEDMRRRYLAM